MRWDLHHSVAMCFNLQGIFSVYGSDDEHTGP